MKKSYITVALIACAAFSANAFAKDLPFIGERNFYIQSFHLNAVIKISKNGSTTITGCGNTSCPELYRGKFKTLIPLGDGVYVKLMPPSHVYFTDSKGKLLRDCHGGGIYKTGCITNYMY